MNFTNATDSVNIREAFEVYLEPYKYIANEYAEDNGSITLTLIDMPVMDNGKNKDEALTNLAKYILAHAQLYFERRDWAFSNCISEFPYVLKAVILNDIEKIKELIICRHGEI